MITLRKSKDRGYFDHGWLRTHHTFSFADYRDESFMGFRSLRVINEDFVVPDEGFGTHGHRDMEIITYILEGKLAHKDSMENGSTIVPGDVQRMTAGTGVRHSEVNPSKDQLVHLMQIWILPEKQGLTPSYEQKHFDYGARENQLRLIGSRDGREGSVTIHQDVDLYASNLTSSTSLNFVFRPNRYGWLQVARGTIEIQGSKSKEKLEAGDGSSISNERELRFSGEGEFLLFDLN